MQYVVGADHTFGSLSIIVQYLGRYVFDWQKETGRRCRSTRAMLKMASRPTQQPDGLHGPATNEVNAELAQISQILFSQTARVQHVATLRFEWLALHETLSISSLCLLQLHHAGMAGHAAHRLKLTDAMTASSARRFRRPERHAVRPDRPEA